MRNVHWLTAFLTAIVLYALPATAQEACISPERWLQDMTANVDSRLAISQLADLDGEKGKAAIARINAVPPATDIAADRIIILTGTLKATGQMIPNVLFALFNQGCLVTFQEIDGATLLTIIREDPGEGA